MCCYNRTEKPWTCCCGCTLTTGIVILLVLTCVSFVGGLAQLELTSIVSSSVDIILYSVLLCYRNSYTARARFFIVQCVLSALSFLGGIVSILLTDIRVTCLAQQGNTYSVD